MSYITRLDRAFADAPVLPVGPDARYVFFSDCHRGIGNNNDNFLKNINSYFAALQYYFQYGFCYIEAGDGDELWENRRMSQISEIHDDVFRLLSRFYGCGRLYMLYGNHDIVKRRQQAALPGLPELRFHEGLILKSESAPLELRVAHGHQADLFNSVFWRLARFLVRYLWAPLESFGVLDPTSSAKNNTKKDKLERKYVHYAREAGILLLTGHTHRPMLGSGLSPYFNCGSCVHPRGITCIELCGFRASLIKWHASAEKSRHFGSIYGQCPPTFPLYITREVLGETELTPP